MGTIGAEVIKSSSYLTALRKGSSCVVFARDTQSLCVCVSVCCMLGGDSVCSSVPTTHAQETQLNDDYYMNVSKTELQRWVYR